MSAVKMPANLQLCLALLLMYLVFIIGIDFNNDILCTAVSLLIQYFALASMFWMGAEAVLMMKLIIVLGEVTTCFLVTLSVCCWGKF